MKKRDLVAMLSNYSDDTEVWICQESEFENSPIEDVYMKKIQLREDPDGKTLSEETVIILTDSI